MRLTSLVLVALFAGCLGPIAPSEPSGPRDGPIDQAVAPDDGAMSADAPADPEQSDPSNASADPDIQSQDRDGQSTETTPRPPAPIHWEASMGWVALPAAGPWTECNAPLTGCDGPSFTTYGTFDLEATLSWDLPTTDFNLYLYRVERNSTYEISRDGLNNETEPTTSQVLHYPDLPPGFYRLWAVPQHGVKTDCELDVVFT